MSDMGISPISVKFMLDQRNSCNFSEFFLLKHARCSFFWPKKYEAAGKKCEAGHITDYILSGETLNGIYLRLCFGGSNSCF